MNKKINLLFILVLVISLFACQATATPTEEPAEPEATEVPVEEPVEAAEISVSYMASGTYDMAAEDIAAELKDVGIDVTVAAFPWAVLRQNNTNDLLSGTQQYDAMSGGYYLADVYEFMAPLGDYFAQDNIGEGVIDGLMQKAEFYQGEPIGVPYGIDAYGVLYRTDLFESAGASPEIANWADYVTLLGVLQDELPEGISPFVFAYGAIEQIPSIFFGEYGGTYINEDGKFELDVDKAVPAVQTMAEMLPYAPDNALALTIDEANAVFLNGEAAMLIGWPSFVRDAANDPEQSQIAGNWAQMEFPGVGFPWLSMWNIFMNDSSENKDATWEWIKSYTSEENSTRWLKEYGIGSIYISTYSDPDIVAAHGHDLPIAMKNFERALNPALSGEAQDFLAATISEVMLGELTPEEAITKINEKWATLTVPEAIMEMGTRTGLAK
jgi:ABC-type glycerol-3-phosphate transport system substrate-binding protein